MKKKYSLEKWDSKDKHLREKLVKLDKLVSEEPILLASKHGLVDK